MRCWWVRQLLLLVLAGIVSLGIGVSTAASNDFAIRNVRLVAMVNDLMTMDCLDRDKGWPCAANALCAVVCGGPVMALPPLSFRVEQAAFAFGFETVRAKSLAGSGPPPELSPPRTTDIA
jgi:hypothetical protein